MGINVIPILGAYKKTGMFRFWCQHVLPLVYDDSLSYYELLCKVVRYLNDVIENLDTAESNIDALNNAVIQLQEYVNNYFDNLDVQDEIDHKLDEMVTDGTFMQIMRDYLPFVYPEMYGAKGDNVTDDTQAVKDAVDSGKLVVLLNTYYVTGRIRFKHDNIKIVGAHKGTGIRWGTYAGETYHIGGASLNNITLEGIKLDFGTQTTALHSFSLFNCNNINVENCEITGGYGYACRFNDCGNVNVRNCYFHDIDGVASNPGGGIYGSGFHDFVFDGCVFEHLGDHGIYCAGSNAVYNGSITNCIFKFNGENGLTNGAGVVLYGNCHDVVVSNDVFSSCATGIHIGDYSGVTETPYNINVTGCSINASTANGIEIISLADHKSYNISITDCTIRNSGQDGIVLRNAEFCTINDNAIYATERYAIALSNSNDTTVDANVIRLVKDVGIVVGDPEACNDITVSNCVITTNSSGDYAGNNAIYTRPDTNRTRCVNNKARGFIENFRYQGVDNVNFLSFNYAKSIYWSASLSGFSGYMNVGDILLITTPVAGQPCAYICTVAGAPGTLKAIATVAN